MDDLVRFEDAALGYDAAAPVLQHVDLSLVEGEFLGLVGPNGSGKTTLVKTLLGALEPLSGRVSWKEPRPAIGYVAQERPLDVLWPLTVEDMVLMGRYPRMGWLPGPPPEKDRSALEDALRRCDLIRLRDTPIRELSVGQAQRALIARALVSDPELLVLDEPTRAMDLSVTAEVGQLIRELHSETGPSTVLVSHDLNLVASLAHRVALLHEGAVHSGDTDKVLGEERLREVFGDRFDADLMKQTGLFLPRFPTDPRPSRRSSRDEGETGNDA